MGTEKFYKPSSFYRIDDRTGFAVRAEYQKREWQGLFVDKRVWEQRHPQDFVRGVPDNQTVPYARPRQPNMFIGETAGVFFEVYNIPGQFLAQGGQIQAYAVASQVDPSKYPKSF